MSLFRQRRPHPFRQDYIYGEERKLRIAEMERQIRGETDTEETFRPENLRGTYVQATRHLRRKKENDSKWLAVGTTAKVIAIVVLILIWMYLL